MLDRRHKLPASAQEHPPNPLPKGEKGIAASLSKVSTGRSYAATTEGLKALIKEWFS